jgi:conserved oligomeric Golgi complex subunit 3
MDLAPLSSHASPMRPAGEAERQQRQQQDDAKLAFHANQVVAHEECISAVPNVSDWLSRVRKARSQGEAILGDVDALSSRLQSLCEISRAVKAQSDHLSANASTLMVRKAKLEHVQEALQQHIRRFTKVEDLVREAEHPLLSATSARFPLLLQEMEDTMLFLTENHNLKSAKPYAAKLALAQQRALVCLRDAVCTTFHSAQGAVVSSADYTAAFRSPTNIPLIATSSSLTAGGAAGGTLRNATVSQVISSAGAETGGEAEKLRALLATLNDAFTKHLDGAPASQRRLVETRCVGVEEDVHLSDILAAYRDARTQLLFPILHDWLDAAASGGECNTLASFATTVCSFLSDVFVEEQSLYDTVWLREDICHAWEALARDIGEELYHCFRARLLQTDRLDELSFGVESLQQTVSMHHTSPSAEYAALIKKMIQDTQERIVFRVSVHLRSVIASRRVSSDEARAILKSLLPQTLSMVPDEEANVDKESVPLHPSLQECMSFLNMLYPAVERTVFGVFADECIHMTLNFFGKLVKQMQQQSQISPNAPLLGSLYHLLHLLMLRETVTRYEVNLKSESKNVDLTFLVQRKMEIVQSSREARKDIETDMKFVCEDIMNTLVKNIVAAAAPGAAPMEEATRLLYEADMLVSRFIESGSTRSVLMRPIQARVEAALQERIAQLQQGDPLQHPPATGNFEGPQIVSNAVVDDVSGAQQQTTLTSS